MICYFLQETASKYGLIAIKLSNYEKLFASECYKRINKLTKHIIYKDNLAVKKLLRIWKDSVIVSDCETLITKDKIWLQCSRQGWEGGKYTLLLTKERLVFSKCCSMEFEDGTCDKQQLKENCQTWVHFQYIPFLIYCFTNSVSWVLQKYWTHLRNSGSKTISPLLSRCAASKQRGKNTSLHCGFTTASDILQAISLKGSVKSYCGLFIWNDFCD